jgi:phosphatidylglycerophosphate synthase
MIDRELRKLKDQIYLPAASWSAQVCTPAQITVVAGGVGMLAAVTAAQGSFLIGLVLWWLNRFLDGLDGAVARVSNRQSDFGGYLDMITDFVVYTAVVFGIALHNPTPDRLIALAFLIGTYYINSGAFLYLSSILERKNRGAKEHGELTSVTMPRGLIEGFESMVAYSIFFLLPDLLVPLFVIFGCGVLLTTGLHLRWAARNL